jgi:predicted XRE-type DNA-binding protein
MVTTGDDAPEVPRHHFRTAWEARDKHYRACLVALKSAYEEGIARAALLVEARAWVQRHGLPQSSVADVLGLSQGRVSQLCRYYAWLASDPGRGLRLTEGRFRAYWQQLAAQGSADRQRVFATIAARVAQGQPPTARPHAPTPHRVAPRRTRRRAQPALRKEVSRLYREEIGPEARVLSRLMTVDRVEWAPTVIAARADRLRRGMQHLQEVLKSLQLLEDEERDEPQHG